MRRPFLAGNWKMNLGQREAVRLAGAIKASCASVPDRDVAICPTFVSVAAVATELEESSVGVGGQDCAQWDAGAYTGEVSAEILRSTGARFVILGHSERRHVMGETDDVVRAKMGKARAAGLKPILCVGETLDEREGGRLEEIVGGQLDGSLAGIPDNRATDVVVAYEPVWAIGTGKTATPELAQEVHAFIRGKLRDRFGAADDAIRIQYGGSVKPDNVAELMAQPDIDGGLVGGASLEPESFAKIANFNR